MKIKEKQLKKEINRMKNQKITQKELEEMENENKKQFHENQMTKKNITILLKKNKELNEALYKIQ